MSRYIRKETLSLEDGLKKINTDVSSLRLKTFATKGTCCSYCGLQATHFALEKCKGSKLDRYHMNLWGVRNEQEILFTHDHVHARSLGGADTIDNSVTACEKCNSRKSKYENRLLFELKRLKISVDFDGLCSIIKTLYQQPNILKLWFINPQESI